MEETMSDMMAVGPRVMSLDVPRKMYTKLPMNAEYKPYYSNMRWEEERVNLCVCDCAT